MKKEPTDLKTAQMKLMVKMIELEIDNKQLAQKIGVETEAITKFLKESARLLSMGTMTKIYKFLDLEMPPELLKCKKEIVRKEKKQSKNHKKVKTRRDLEDILLKREEDNYYGF